MTRRWFFLLTAANLLFLGLFALEEWRPEWKAHQRQWQARKAAALKEEIQVARQRRIVDGQDLSALREALAREEEFLASGGKAERRLRLEEALAEAQERLEETNDRYQRSFSRYQLLEIRYHQRRDEDGAKQELGEELRKFKLRLEVQKQDEERIHLEVDALEAQWAALAGERDRLRAEVRTAEFEVGRLEDRLGSVVRQRPKIQQITNPELGLVDRCPTCHRGIDDPHFALADPPLGAHREQARVDLLCFHPPAEYGCTPCHDGQGLATSLPESHGQEAHFYFPLLAGDLAEGLCLPCHASPIPFPGAPAIQAAPLLEAGRRLFVDKGCTGCHDAAGFADLPRTGPKLSSASFKLREDWLHRWLRRPTDYLPRTNMPDFLLPPAEITALRDFLLLRMRQAAPTPAPPRPEDPETAFERGRDVFQVARCISCHALEGKGGTIGPDLARVASKVRRDWLFAWLENPAAYHPETKMPRFRFSEEERLDLVEYITQEFVDWDLPPEPDPVEGAPPSEERALQGEALVRRYGCFGCHEMEGYSGQQKVSTDLGDFGAKTINLLDFGWAWDVPRARLDWTLTKLRTPRIFRDTLLMPDYRLGEAQIRALTAVLLSFKGKPAPAKYVYQPPAAPLIRRTGEFARLVDEGRCLSCHRLGEEGGELAPDLTRVGSRLQEEFIFSFLKNPGAIRPLLVERMLRLGLSDEEARSLAEGLAFLCRDDAIPEQVPAGPPGDAARGEELYVGKFGCQGCHMIGAEGGSSGPNLSDVGLRLRPGYLYAWLLDPQALVPKALEPDYGMSDEEARHVTAFLLSLREAVTR